MKTVHINGFRLSQFFKCFNHALKLCGLLCFTLAAFLYGSEDSVTLGRKAVPNDTVNLDKIVITARGYEKPISNTPGGVGIIMSNEIEDNQGVSVTNFLEMVPGASKCSDGAWGSDISIRGLDRDRVMMLIDNVRINTASALNFKLGTIDPAWVERIEILKGPISSIYGSGSFGGVVNVITRKGYFSEKPEFDTKLSLGYGSNGFSKRLFAYGAYNAPNYYISLGMSGRDQNLYTSGYGDINDDEKTDGGDEVRSTQFADAEGKFNAGVKLNKLNRIDFTVDYFRGENVGLPGGSGNYPGSPVGKPDISYAPCSRLLIDAAYTYTPENSLLQEYKLQLNFVNLYRLVYFRNFPTKSDYPAGTPISKLGSTFLDSIKAYTRHPSYSLKSYIVLAPENHKIVTGVDMLIRTSEQGRERWFNANPPLMSGNQNNYVKDAPFPEIFFLTGGVFAEDDWSIGKYLELNYGGRIDGIYVTNEADSLWHENKNNKPPNKLLWTEGEENELSWDAHLGVTGKIHEYFKATGLFSRGYRAASMEERYRYVDLGSKKQYVKNSYCYEFVEENAVRYDSIPFRYEWRFGDGNKATGFLVEHCYSGPGTYLVELDVTNLVTMEVSLNEKADILVVQDIEQPYISCQDIADAGIKLNFSADSTNLPGWDLSEYFWNFGDETIAIGKNVEKSFRRPGNYSIQLIVSTKTGKDGIKNEACVSKNISIIKKP